ncbi:unnamed protein product, partial [Ixodes hexagonus]
PPLPLEVRLRDREDALEDVFESGLECLAVDDVRETDLVGAVGLCHTRGRAQGPGRQLPAAALVQEERGQREDAIHLARQLCHGRRQALEREVEPLRRGSARMLTVDRHELGLGILAGERVDVARVAAAQLSGGAHQVQRPELGEAVAAGQREVEVEPSAEPLGHVPLVQLGDPLVDGLRVVVQEPLDHQLLVVFGHAVHAVEQHGVLGAVLDPLGHGEVKDVHAAHICGSRR